MTAANADELVFRMIGTWWRVDLSSPEATAESAKQMARGMIGTDDRDATHRAKIRADLIAAADAARAGDAQLMMLQTELSPGTPMSASLTLFADDRLRMSPSIGTDSSTVLEVLERSLTLMDPALAETATRRRSADGDVLRVHTVEETVAEEQGERFTERRLVAQYFYPVPGSKQLLLAVFSTPLGDIPNALLSYFDAIVEASHYRTPLPV